MAQEQLAMDLPFAWSLIASKGCLAKLPSTQIPGVGRALSPPSQVELLCLGLVQLCGLPRPPFHHACLSPWWMVVIRKGHLADVEFHAYPSITHG